MGFNYAQAFLEQPGLSEEQIKQIGVAAILAYRFEFPDVEYIEVEFYMETKHVEAAGGPESRLYSWKQLGFKL